MATIKGDRIKKQEHLDDIASYDFHSGCTECWNWKNQICKKDTLTKRLKEVKNVYQLYNSNPGNNQAGCVRKIDIAGRQKVETVAEYSYDSFGGVTMEITYDLMKVAIINVYTYKSDLFPLKSRKIWAMNGYYRIDYEYSY